MKRHVLSGVMALCLAALPLLSACDDEGDKAADVGSSVTLGPDRTEAKVDEAKLRSFVGHFPPAPEGFTRAPDPGVYSSDSGSTVSFAYEKEGATLLLAITFSNENAKQSLDMMGDQKTLDLWGFTVTEIAGRKALSAKERGMGKADFLVVISNSRSVSIMPASDPAPDIAVAKALIESVDFNAIAARD